MGLGASFQSFLLGPEDPEKANQACELDNGKNPIVETEHRELSFHFLRFHACFDERRDAGAVEVTDPAQIERVTGSWRK